MRVVIADDTLLIRSGLTTLLTGAGIHVVATAQDADEALRAVSREQPDAVIVDIRMPPTYTDEGLVAAQRMRREFPHVAVLVLSQYLESSYALRLISDDPESIGYLLKDRVSDASMLTDALHRVVAGECVIDPAIVRRILQRTRSRGPLATLTEREQEVLALMAEGRSNRAIAETLSVAGKTVETHIGRVFDKLGLPEGPGAHRRVLAVLAYFRHGQPASGLAARPEPPTKPAADAPRSTVSNPRERP